MNQNTGKNEQDDVTKIGGKGVEEEVLPYGKEDRSRGEGGLRSSSRHASEHPHTNKTCISATP
jgi:hypothetical protein